MVLVGPLLAFNPFFKFPVFKFILYVSFFAIIADNVEPAIVLEYINSCEIEPFGSGHSTSEV